MNLWNATSISGGGFKLDIKMELIIVFNIFSPIAKKAILIIHSGVLRSPGTNAMIF
jgi:hypothetical protein